MSMCNLGLQYYCRSSSFVVLLKPMRCNTDRPSINLDPFDVALIDGISKNAPP
jgi:hypothetical protein